MQRNKGAPDGRGVPERVAAITKKGLRNTSQNPITLVRQSQYASIDFDFQFLPQCREAMPNQKLGFRGMQSFCFACSRTEQPCQGMGVYARLIPVIKASALT
jgi:hypothetical protein